MADSLDAYIELKVKLLERARLFDEEMPKDRPDYNEVRERYMKFLTKKYSDLKEYMPDLKVMEKNLWTDYEAIERIDSAIKDKLDRAKERGKDYVCFNWEDMERYRQVIKDTADRNIVAFANIKHLVEL